MGYPLFRIKCFQPTEEVLPFIIEAGRRYELATARFIMTHGTKGLLSCKYSLANGDLNHAQG